MEKYYTPTIEEFHIGFEYERLQRFPDAPFISLENPNNEPQWIQHICNHKNLPNNLPDLLENFPNIRVKHLDREDIESLGWCSEQILDVWLEGSEFELGYSFEITDISTAHFMYDSKTFKVRIYRADEYNTVTRNWTEHILFDGKIKNKSELKKLMQQLNIQ